MSDHVAADRGGHEWRSLVTSAALALTLGAMAAVMFASHRAGHWWGDDWALYIRQAQSLIDGNPGQVTSDNLFTVESSRGAAFSPPLYPWGFPILLSPFVAVLGTDVDRLAVVPVLSAIVFAWAWFLLAKPRLGSVPALVGVVAVTMTPLLLGWTELIQSEWPFLAVTGVVLLAIDRVAARNGFVDLHAPLWPLALIGMGAAATFSVRREGLAMVGAIAAAQLAGLVAARWRNWSDAPYQPLPVRLLLPHMTALLTVGIGQLVLPSTLVPRYSGTSVTNVWKFRRDHVEHLAEVSGLKRSWQSSPEVFGNSTLGWIAVAAYFTAAVAGIVLAIVVYRRRDLHLVAYAFGALLIGGSFRSPINRYVCSIAPILLLLGAVAISTAARQAPWRHTATVVVTVVLAALALGNVAQARTRVDHARTIADNGSIEWGPTHPLAIEMFEAVDTLSRPGDVIAAPKARAMTLETRRRAIQVDDYRAIPTSVPLALVVVERDSDLAAELASDTTGYREVWSNSRFVIYEPVLTVS
ncbi:hypothetical protein [Ilumatobacter sp.]|uniref:hypothetical protein n=1 Tax=Ilumatobacter sp. TaxID=1967498 RepID=UPI003AF98A15